MEFFQRKEIRDVLAYLQVIHNPRDDETLLRVINTPARGIGRTTIERLADHGVSNGLSLLEARDCRAISSLTKRAAGQVGKFVDLIDRLARWLMRQWKKSSATCLPRPVTGNSIRTVKARKTSSDWLTLRNC